MTRSKFNNKACYRDGAKFDSHMERTRYDQLKFLLSVGKISDLRLQPKFLIIEGYRRQSGKKVAPTFYIADFQYTDNNSGKQFVEDVKGKETEVFRIKRKLFETRYGQDVVLITKDDL